jgi:asparagine synthase (glutamine-hydrolysing)
MKLDKILDSKLISQYCLNDPPITLVCDLAAAFPLYLYLAADQQTLLYSLSIKVRNFCDSSQCNLILPFADQSIAEYFGKMPEVYLFDRKQLKNKLILRQILKGRMGLDSDVVGKMHFTYDYRSVVLQNWDWFSQEIQQCHLWNQSAMVKLLARLKLIMLSKHQSSEFSRNLIYRVYLLSAWFNRNRYLSGSNK